MSEGRSGSGIPLRPFYRPEDGPGGDEYARLGDPGSYPYTRGRRPPRPGAEAWIQRELSGEGPASRSNAQFKDLLAQGATGVDVIGDTPTLACLDPDHPAAAHAVGTQGVSLCRRQDFVDLYRDLPLDRITVSHSLQPAFGIAGLWLGARALGFDPKLLRGSMVQAPFYCEDCGYATHMPFPLRLRLSVDSIAFAAREMPKFHAFLEDTYYISDGGLDAVEEMALGFVEIRYVARALLARGLAIDDFAPRIAILVNCRMDFFEEIAKIRATRRLFARMMKEEFGARDPRSLAVNIASHTSGLSMTAQQPVNNIMRGATQALALALAGVQGIEISAFDEAYRTPSPESHVVALRTQQIIGLESNVTRVTDPLGGSWYVEALTDEIERRIGDRVARIESMGDPAALCDDGYFRQVFLRAMERYGQEVRSGERPVVGVNRFPMPAGEDTLLREMTERKIEPWRDWIETIRTWKKGRDLGAVRGALAVARDAAADPRAELLGPIVAALEADATTGEIAAAMRQACGLPGDPYGKTAAAP